MASVSEHDHDWTSTRAYVDQKSRCNAQAAIDAIEHTPSKSAAVDAVLAQAADAETTAVVDTPSKYA